MLDPAKLSPQTRQLFAQEGLKAGLRTDQPMGATELKTLLKGIDKDADGQLSQSEAKAVKISPQDRSLINEALKSSQGTSKPSLDLGFDSELSAANFKSRFGAALQDAIREPAPGPKKDFFAAVPPVFKSPPPKPAPPSRFGNEILSFETRPEIKVNDNPTSDAPKTLEKLTLHGQGNFGDFSVGSDLQFDAKGEAVGGGTTLNYEVAPALRLGARLDTEPLIQGGLPPQIELSGEGKISSLTYSSGMTYGDQGLNSTRGSLGVELFDGLSLGVAGSQQMTEKGLTVKEVGLTTGHQFGALNLGSRLNFDAVTSKPSAGASLGYQVSPSAKLDLNGDSDGKSSRVGLSFKSTF